MKKLLIWSIFGVKHYMNLVVVSNLTCNEGLFFRYVTMISKEEIGLDVLVEARRKEVDAYYKTLKSKGWIDFVDDFVYPEWKIEGIRLDTELNYPMTIRTSSISCENALNLTGQIKSLSKVC